MPAAMNDLRAALLSAGASADLADKAAIEAAGDVGSLKADVGLLKWMVGGLYAILLLTLPPAFWLLIRVAAKVGAL